jgi:hypothetical protein
MRTITNNEDYVRLRIYEGDLKIDEASAEMLRLERCQRQAERLRFEQIIERLRTDINALRAQLSNQRK